MSRNYRVLPEKFRSVPIPGKTSRFPEQFWLCPETAFVRVVTPRHFYWEVTLLPKHMFVTKTVFAGHGHL